MSGANVSVNRPLQRQAAADRLAATGRGIQRRPAPTARRIARRRFMVGMTKWALPLLALLLLGSIAAWPEISRITDNSRVAFRRAMQLEVDSGLMRSPRYHGVDQRGRPYTITATTANQTSPERIALVDPKADLTTEAGSWVMVQAQEGVFIQHQSLLDLSKEVTLYREDGTMLSTDTAAMDLKAGAGTSSDKTHAEGPFGTLDAQGFTMTEKGSVIQFQGASHAILNAADAKPAAPASTPTPATTEAPAR
jgi:lipopolysaccharide export system protein LptC